MESASDYNRKGVEWKRQGRVAEAAACYENAIRLEPHFAEARYNLGILWRDLGRIDLALASVEAAAKLRPDVPQVHVELGNLCRAHGYSERARHCFEQALALAPQLAEAHFNLGQTWLDERRWPEAEAVFHALLKLNPHDADAWASLGIALHEQQDDDGAEAAYREAISRQPDHAVAWTNLGTLLKRAGQLVEAVACYRRALEASPELHAALANLGHTHLELGEFNDALVQYQRAARLAPASAQSFIDLGNTYRGMERTADAESAYKRAIELDENGVDARLSLGHLYRELGDFYRARETNAEICRRNPESRLHRLRWLASCPLVWSSSQALDEYRGELVSMLSEAPLTSLDVDLARWTVYAPECPYNLQFLDGNLRDAKVGFAHLYHDYLVRCWPEDRYPLLRSERPRVGVVVTSHHETAFLKLIAPVFARIDSRKFEVVVICSKLGAARIREGLRSSAVGVVEFPERFDHIVDTVRRAACDVLYYWEVGNDPTNYFLPFLRLAPRQVASWGIQVTSGIPNMDVYVSSSLVESADAPDHYSERLMLASTLLTYQPATEPNYPRRRREHFELPRKARWYGCIQNLGKFHPDFDHLLADILRRDPQGILVVGEDRNGYSTRVLRERWTRTLPDVVSRMRFVPSLPGSEYLSLLAQCDVLLDPLHFGGVTTAYDALLLGKPIVTLPSPFHRGRYTAACLRKMGVTRTIATDSADYVNLAVELAGNPDLRYDLKRQIESTRELVFEDQVAVHEHERIFQELLAEVR